MTFTTKFYVSYVLKPICPGIFIQMFYNSWSSDIQKILPLDGQINDSSVSEMQCLQVFTTALIMNIF
uniref:Uncharacterized protein n=1 Tax=Arundo donax TaxID=35708 RepID=A0A0A9F3U1_ARUDO